MAVDCRADRFEEYVAGSGKLATHEQQLWVDDVDEGGKNGADRFPRVCDGSLCSTMVLRYEFEERGDRYGSTGASFHKGCDGDGAGDCLEASAVAATADWALPVGQDVADFL